MLVMQPSLGFQQIWYFSQFKSCSIAMYIYVTFLFVMVYIMIADANNTEFMIVFVKFGYPSEMVFDMHDRSHVHRHAFHQLIWYKSLVCLLYHSLDHNPRFVHAIMACFKYILHGNASEIKTQLFIYYMNACLPLSNNNVIMYRHIILKL